MRELSPNEMEIISGGADGGPTTNFDITCCITTKDTPCLPSIRIQCQFD